MADMPPRLTEVGDQERQDHFYLPADSQCYFWGEYTSYRGYGYSPTNHLIINFKKKLDRRGQPDWKYKGVAIERVARNFSEFWKWGELHTRSRVALIPIPPSRPRADPMYDPRMLDMLQRMGAIANVPLDIRDCFSFSGRYAASHASIARPTPDQLFADLSLDQGVARLDDQPGVIFLFDDLLTTGAHFVAVARFLALHFPDVPIIGNFIARRIIPNPFEDCDKN